MVQIKDRYTVLYQYKYSNSRHSESKTVRRVGGWIEYSIYKGNRYRLV